MARDRTKTKDGKTRKKSLKSKSKEVKEGDSNEDDCSSAKETPSSSKNETPSPLTELASELLLSGECNLSDANSLEGKSPKEESVSPKSVSENNDGTDDDHYGLSSEEDNMEECEAIDFSTFKDMKEQYRKDPKSLSTIAQVQDFFKNRDVKEQSLVSETLPISVDSLIQMMEFIPCNDSMIDEINDKVKKDYENYKDRMQMRFRDLDKDFLKAIQKQKDDLKDTSKGFIEAREACLLEEGNARLSKVRLTLLEERVERGEKLVQEHEDLKRKFSELESKCVGLEKSNASYCDQIKSIIDGRKDSSTLAKAIGLDKKKSLIEVKSEKRTSENKTKRPSDAKEPSWGNKRKADIPEGNWGNSLTLEKPSKRSDHSAHSDTSSTWDSSSSANFNSDRSYGWNYNGYSRTYGQSKGRGRPYTAPSWKARDDRYHRPEYASQERKDDVQGWRKEV